MKYYIIAAILLLSGIAYALDVQQCTTQDNKVSVRLGNIRTLPDLTDPEPNQLVLSQTYALPYQQAALSVNSMTWKEFDRDGNYLRTSNSLDYNAIYLANSFSFREMNGFTINLHNQVGDINTIKVLEQVDFEVTGTNPIELPQEISPTFVKAYQKLATNYDTSYLRNLPLSRPKLLIISHTTVTPYLVNFVAWKRAKGYEVYVENVQNIGANPIAIRDFVLSHYLQYKSDHLLILGDATGAYAIPTNIYSSPPGAPPENDADDNFYTMLTGDDYFPEMVVGRFSFGDISELLVMTNKTISYERNPFMSNTNWMRRNLVVAGNYAEGNLRPVTPYQMSMWLREKMLAKGYMQVDTVFYTQENPTYPGTSYIQASINQGVQLISYRGWGAADGWHYPSFHNVDLNSSLVNGSKMPIVMSIVCNTGDFANSVNPCFGEKWMRMGTIESPGGCVGFVGPSDLHTKTNLNNTISSGLFSSILDDGERNIAAAVLAGKMELYHTYPLDLANNGYVAFYFHVYNILSDPSMNMWILVPSTIPASVITNGTTFSQSDSHIQIQAPNLNGAIVTGTKNNLDYTYANVHDGIAILPINPEQTGNLTVTISKENFVPRVATLTPSQPSGIGVANANDIINWETSPIPGNGYYFTLHLKNYSSSTATNIPVHLAAEPDNFITIVNPDTIITSLAPGATFHKTYTYIVAGNTPYGTIMRLNLTFPGYSGGWSYEDMIGGARVNVLTHTGSLNIGTNNSITLILQNTGNAQIYSGTVTVHSLTTAATVINEQSTITNFNPLYQSSVGVNINVQSDCFPGHVIPLSVTVSNSAGYNTTCRYDLIAGNPTAADPTGPDSYGYFAYDSFDTSYPQHPTYNWTEIDPRDGGQGSVFLNTDDGSHTVNLPFTFRYYGVDYNSMTICTNGWVSFVTTWMTDFNNLHIPAALGPYAMVAPYWDDLKGMKVMLDTLNFYFEDMRIVNWYDQANNRYIVEWNDAYSQYTINLLQNAHLEKFQMILYPNDNADGDIVFQYHTIDNPALTSNFSTVGIENHHQDDGLTYSYADIYPVTARPLQAGLAVKFTTSPPDNYVGNEDYQELQTPFILAQNYPNPFNPETTIAFSVAAKTDVTLDIYNMKGQKIRTLHSGMLDKGNHQLVWNGKDDKDISVSSGVYVYKMKSVGYTQTRKMILMK